MPARAFVDSDPTNIFVRWAVNKSKCPRGHLLILIQITMMWGQVFGLSKCPRGHLLILMHLLMPGKNYLSPSKCPRGHLLILMRQTLTL